MELRSGKIFGRRHGNASPLSGQHCFTDLDLPLPSSAYEDMPWR